MDLEEEEIQSVDNKGESLQGIIILMKELQNKLKECREREVFLEEKLKDKNKEEDKLKYSLKIKQKELWDAERKSLN